MDDESVSALRVSQLDSATLDKEIENVIGDQLKKFLESIPGYDFSWLEPEFEASIKSIFWFFVFRNEGATLGQKMMDMSYRRLSIDSISDNRWKWIYLFCTVVWPWLRQRAPSIISRRYGDDDDRRSRIDRLSEKCESIIEAINLINFLFFLNRGGRRTILERLLGLKSVHNSQPYLEELDTELTERELLWHGFSDILIFFAPLINYRRFYNLVSRFGKRLGRLVTTTRIDSIDRKVIRSDILSFCTYCGEKPPILPCHLGCNHVYCYYCLAANLKCDRNYSCSICGYAKSDRGLIFVKGDNVGE